MLVADSLYEFQEMSDREQGHLGVLQVSQHMLLIDFSRAYSGKNGWHGPLDASVEKLPHQPVFAKINNIKAAHGTSRADACLQYSAI